MAVFAQSFTLESKSLSGQATRQDVFNGFGCTGNNISPQLQWFHPPKGTKSFALTMYDPDAPTGSGWWHWLAFNIPLSVDHLDAGAGSSNAELMPASVIQSITDYGTKGYGGPCPPEGHGAHRYIVTVYALKTASLDLSADAMPALVGYYLNANTIQKASLVFYHER